MVKSATKKQIPSMSLQVRWQHIVMLVIIALALYVVVPQLSQFRSSFQALREANLSLVVVASLCIFTSVLSAAGAYRLLSFRKIPYRRIALVQYSSMFINRLLPAGLGGASLFVDFFYRHKHSFGKATAVVAVNSMLGLAAHWSLVAVCLLFFNLRLPEINLPTFEVWLAILLVLLAVGVVLSIVVRSVQSGKVGGTLRDMGRAFSQFRKRPQAISAALVFAFGNTLMHVLAMTFVITAFGQPFSFPTGLVVLTGGVFAATISPTPGGLLASEAGITAMLVAYGLPVGPALAVALTYRFVSYWLPILPGVVAFLYARNKRYV